MQKYAIITNDLQYDLVNKNEKRKAALEAFRPGMRDFLDFARSRGMPVIHLQLINRPDDPRAERYGDYLPVLKGSEGAKILDCFLDPSDIVIEKNKDSGFFETTLDSKLKELKVDTIIITGMQTQICVQTTAADGYFRGYNVLVPPDAVFAANIEDTNRALHWLGSYCAKVILTGEIISSLSQNRDIKFEPVPSP
jgi:nicotinamidase-related amidase